MKRIFIALLCVLLCVSCKKEEKQDNAVAEAIGKQVGVSISKARCNEVPKNFKWLIDKAVEYEAINGYWPENIDELDVDLASKFWQYSILSNKNDREIVFKAELVKMNSIGDLQVGAYITINSFGDREYSHRSFADVYLKAYLRDAKYTGTEGKRQLQGNERVHAKRLIIAHCSEIPRKMRMIMDHAVMHEAEMGEWPRIEDLQERRVSTKSKYFSYDVEVIGRDLWVVARVNEGVALGNIEAGEEIRISVRGDKAYSHNDFLLYMETYLAGAQKM